MSDAADDADDADDANSQDMARMSSLHGSTHGKTDCEKGKGVANCEVSQLIVSTMMTMMMMTTTKAQVMSGMM